MQEINYAALFSKTTRRERKAVHSTYPSSRFQNGTLLIAAPLLVLVGLYGILIEGQQAGIIYFSTLLGAAYLAYTCYGVYRSGVVSVRLQRFARANNFDFIEYDGKAMPQDGRTYTGNWKVIRGQHAKTTFKMGVYVYQRKITSYTYYGSFPAKLYQHGFLRLKITDKALPHMQFKSQIELLKHETAVPKNPALAEAFKTAHHTYRVEIKGKYLYFWYPQRLHGKQSIVHDLMSFTAAYSYVV